MRNPGENATGRAPGRRQSPAGRSTPPKQGLAPAEQAARNDPSLFAPGYSSGRAADRDPGRDSVRDPARAGTGWYGSTGGAVGKGPVRGFPPAPGQPPPLYPPGQFSAWNRTSRPGGDGLAQPVAAGPVGDAWPTLGHAAGLAAPGPAGQATAEPGYADRGYADQGYPDPGYADRGYADQGYTGQGYADPEYPAFAVSDPAADVTSTQTWGIVDDAPAASGWSDLSVTGDRGPRTDGRRESLPPSPAYGAGPAAAAPVPGSPAAEDLAVGGLAAEDLAVPRQRQPGGRADTPPTGTARSATERAVSGPGRGARASTGTRPAPAPGRGPGTRGHGSRRRARPRSRRRRGRALLASALAVAVMGGAAYLWLTDVRPHTTAAETPQRTSTPRPSPTGAAANPAASLGPWEYIKSRASDPIPLTLAELFPIQFTNGTAIYTRTVQKARPSCAPSLIGSRLRSAVKSADCTQAMRASYLSSDQKLMGTIGVLNLTTASAAEKAGKAVGPAEFIAQLPAAKGPTKKLAKGTGIEAAEVKGHYLVLVWAEFANLRAPKTSVQRQDLEAFISLLIQKTANVSLASRMVTDKPAS